MDQEAELINTNTRIEKIKNFFVNKKKNIISIIIITVLCLFGYFFYKDYMKKEKIKIAEKYSYLVSKFDQQNKEQFLEEFKKIISAKDSTYSPLALYYLIDNSLINSQKETNSLFDFIIENIKLEKEIKNLIIYKKALYNSEFETENNLLNILKPVLNSESVWRPHALYLMGEYFYSKGEKQKSKDFFQKIIELKNIDQNILIDAQKKIQRDFSE